MKPGDLWDQSWSNHARQRVSDTVIAATAVLIAVEHKAYLFRDDLEAIDKAVADLKQAKAMHLERLAQYDRKDAAA